jgi:hypothetical protein
MVSFLQIDQGSATVRAQEWEISRLVVAMAGKAGIIVPIRAGLPMASPINLQPWGVVEKQAVTTTEAEAEER